MITYCMIFLYLFCTNHCSLKKHTFHPVVWLLLYIYLCLYYILFPLDFSFYQWSYFKKKHMYRYDYSFLIFFYSFHLNIKGRRGRQWNREMWREDRAVTLFSTWSKNYESELHISFYFFFAFVYFYGLCKTKLWSKNMYKIKDRMLLTNALIWVLCSSRNF